MSEPALSLQNEWKNVACVPTLCEELHTPMSFMVIVITLVASGCPRQAMVHAFGLDERTIAPWRDRAGVPCQRVHEAMMHIHADEIRVTGRSMVV